MVVLKPSRLYHFGVLRCILWLVVGIIGVFTLALADSPVHAQGGYPQPTDLYVNDYAGLLTAEDAANIRTLFADLKRETDIEAVVVTINSIRDYHTGDETMESFATNLFNTWGIGDSERNDGVLILVAVKDRKVRIEVGSGYGSAQNANMQEVINEHMLPHFKRNDYSLGIYRGARVVVGKLTGVWPEDLSQATASPAQAPNVASSQSFGSPLKYFGFFFLFGAIAWLSLDRRWRRRSHKHEAMRYAQRGTIVGAISGAVFSAFLWLGADSGTALWASSCVLSSFIPLGAFAGLALAASSGRSSGWLGGGSFGGGSFGGGSSSGGGASGEW